MDAKKKKQYRPSVLVKVAGREMRMYRPKDSQLMALTMADSPLLPEVARISALSEMFLSLFDPGDDRVHVMRQMAMGEYTIEELTATLKRAATVDTDQPTAAED